MRIAHISDVHIRLKDRHDEYQEVFNRLYEELTKQKPDRILLTGDIVHSKIALSPELVALTVNFLNKLSEIAVVDMIVGNHDMNMSNMDRMDALTPIVDAAQGQRHHINYFKDTKIVQISENLSYGVFSLLDGGDIHLKKKDKKDGHVYIALYHGVVGGAKMDNEYILSDASTSLATFNNFDFAMLGDIHRRQFLNEKKTIAYPGSLIQQNHGEDIEKGFLMWDIRSADDFDVEFVRVYNDYAFATIYAEDGKLPELDLPPKTRIRVVWPMRAQDISRSQATKLNSMIRSKYNPLSVQLTFKPIGMVGVGDLTVRDSDNLADPIVQEDLLRQWFTNLDEDVDVDKLMEIDKQITETVTNNEFEDFSNSKWHLKKLTLENFMSYDEEVEINFDSMRGVIGLFGDNKSGKSVIIDAILYALFNKTTREVKNEDLVNKNTGRESCRVSLVLEIKGVEYEIDRWTTRQYQKRTGRFINARTDVTLKRRYNENDEWENLTETTRNDSEKIIRNAIGSFDDFMITTLSTQGGQSEFLKMKPSPRADTMLRFLGLDIFNKKYDYAKDLLKQVEYERRSYDKKNEVELLDTKKKKVKQSDLDEKKVTKKIKEVDGQIDSLRKSVVKTNKLINTTIKIEKSGDILRNERDALIDEIASLEQKKSNCEDKAKSLVDRMESLENDYVLPQDKIEELVDKRTQADNIRDVIKENERTIESHKRVLKIYRSELENENKCPVSDDERHITCVYLRGYIEKKNECVSLIEKVTALLKTNEILREDLENLDHVYAIIEEQEQIREYLIQAVDKLAEFKKAISNYENTLEVKSVSLRLVESQLKIAENNEETIRKNREHREEISNLENQITPLVSEREELVDKREKIRGTIILLKKEIKDIEDTLENIRKSDERYSLFNVYCNAMHRKGLPVDILKNYIPKINYEINKILSDVVDFGVYLKIEEGETDIDIVMRSDEDGDDTRPAQMGSGMEKLLINMSIRYALLSISNLNTPSSWFIDEGFGVLDADNLYSMAQFFDNVKSVFRNIIIITHIDTLKDVADWVINIEIKGGISKVNSPVKNI